MIEIENTKLVTRYLAEKDSKNQIDDLKQKCENLAHKATKYDHAIQKVSDLEKELGECMSTRE